MDLINDIGPIETKEGVYEVQTLLDHLKQKNRFLSKDQFVELVSSEYLRMGNPYDFGFIENINGRTTRWYTEHKDYTLGERKKYWDYVKKCLFGDSANNNRGLMNINDLTEQDIKEIVELICSNLTANDTESFFLRVRGVGVIDKEDIFCPQNKNILIDDLLEYKNLFISVENDTEKQKVETEFVASQNVTSSISKRQILGIILLLIGIIGCGAVLGGAVLGLDLASKLAVALLSLFASMAVTGTVYVLWEEISCCLTPRCLKIFTSTSQKNLIDIQKNIKQNQDLNLTNTQKKLNERH